MWWLGFRQVRVKTSSGVAHAPGRAVVCGPYQSEGEAQSTRMHNLAKEWDAVYSQPFQANDAIEAGELVESLTPSS